MKIQDLWIMLIGTKLISCIIIAIASFLVLTVSISKSCFGRGGLRSDDFIVWLIIFAVSSSVSIFTIQYIRRKT